MFKTIIFEKKKQIFEKKKSSAVHDVTCIDCGEGDHYTQQYLKCELYKTETADQVGSKGRKSKQNFEIKKEKKKARKDNNEGPDEGFPRRVPLIVFGAGMFEKDVVKLKGQRCGVVGKLFATLKKREAKGQLMVVTIDEFKTSKTCSLRFYGYSWIQGYRRSSLEAMSKAMTERH
ncbi:hypothetical protein BDF20DRAFT_998923 [Mycotypha africana]|uniref:uncharacterized protein n=1 Tax=Mycotypha africana TaxID=64632 RepID=UPI00230193A4|nr:uncharacterized protein BDF20DRAFT_998923 [Mycotypha africana]KAI8988507.1 hypothetical protein BDF20DRAFT_998923 [Mycotypha africana]